MVETPRRIVCLTAETAEILVSLGAADRIVGISGFAADIPQLKGLPKVAGFTTVNIEKIVKLQPDLVLAFSDLQVDIVRDLIRRGVPVFTTNQRTIAEILETILWLGRLVDCQEKARELVGHMELVFDMARQRAKKFPRRPKVYFEEWDDPMISGIAWVSELIEIAGGEDIFPELRDKKSAPERVVSSQQVIDRNPDIILASWCGKKVDFKKIHDRPGWQKISAAQRQRLYEIPSGDILQPGPKLIRGLKRLEEIVSCITSGNGRAVF